ncbi:MAG: hypothetical protein CMJ38_03555 [Phycisphaerae bacterium]|nr:hypothetical protein [Phycisphaerae bacterium]
MGRFIRPPRYGYYKFWIPYREREAKSRHEQACEDAETFEETAGSARTSEANGRTRRLDVGMLFYYCLMLAMLLNLNALNQPLSLEHNVEPLVIQVSDAPMSNLLLLPRVGVKTALKMMTYRKNNQIDSVSDLMNVKGIGPATIDAILPMVEGVCK